VDEFQEAKALGIHTKPVLIGPVTFLLLGKARTARFDRLTLLDALLPVYAEVLSRLAAAGATWVQLDEPCLALDRSPAERAAFVRAYRLLAERVPKVKILVATYFAGSDVNLPTSIDTRCRYCGRRSRLPRAPRFETHPARADQHPSRSSEHTSPSSVQILSDLRVDPLINQMTVGNGSFAVLFGILHREKPNLARPTVRIRHLVVHRDRLVRRKFRGCIDLPAHLRARCRAIGVRQQMT